MLGAVTKTVVELGQTDVVVETRVVVTVRPVVVTGTPGVRTVVPVAVQGQPSVTVRVSDCAMKLVSDSLEKKKSLAKSRLPR